MSLFPQYRQETQSLMTQLTAGSQLLETPHGLLEYG